MKRRQFLIALAGPVLLSGCSLLKDHDSEFRYSGPDRERVERLLRDHAMPIVESVEGRAKFPSRLTVEVRPGSRVYPPSGANVIKSGVRAYFQPPSKIVVAERSWPNDAIVLEELIHLVRYITFGVLDHDPRYNKWWTAH